MTKDEALKLALEALEGWDNHGKWVWPETALEQAKRNTKEAITAIKEALTQPVQKPVDFALLLREAEEIVQSKPTWKRFIDGTPLANDIAVWMAVFAQDVARRTSPSQSQPEERNFCPRCGKRTADLITIHTCTPPTGV
jgi:predicted RNase H-like HicB family nuclease